MKWAEDKDTDHCQLCKQAFSIARRKVSKEICFDQVLGLDEFLIKS
jgi:hypothetical protein